MNLEGKNLKEYYIDSSLVTPNDYDYQKHLEEDFKKYLDSNKDNSGVNFEYEQAWLTYKYLMEKDNAPFTDSYYDCLKRLMWGIPLLSITEEDFIEYPYVSIFAHNDKGPDNKKVVNAKTTKKFFKLVKYELEDGSNIHIDYFNVDVYDINSGEIIFPDWCGDFPEILISTLFPISLPYTVPINNYKLYMEVRGNKFFVDSIITPDINLIKVNKYFEYYFPNLFIKEISKEEFDKEPVECHKSSLTTE